MEAYQKYVYQNRVWFYDARKNPTPDGSPELVAYPEITSIIIDFHLYQYVKGEVKSAEVEISPDYVVNVKACAQIYKLDRKRWRAVFRGDPQKRGDRPSGHHFGSDPNPRVYKAVEKGGGWGYSWLMRSYRDKNGRYPSY